MKNEKSNKKIWSRSMRHNAGSKFTGTGKYIGKFETESEKFLGYYSGAGV
jgi:hypothetical protein